MFYCLFVYVIIDWIFKSILVRDWEGGQIGGSTYAIWGRSMLACAHDRVRGQILSFWCVRTSRRTPSTIMISKFCKAPLSKGECLSTVSSYKHSGYSHYFSLPNEPFYSQCDEKRASLSRSTSVDFWNIMSN